MLDKLTLFCVVLNFVSYSLVTGSCNDDRYRLNGGNNSTSGYLQIFRNSTWYNVCMNDWNIEKGDGLCRQMGFPGALGFSEPVEVDDPDQTVIKYRTLAFCRGSEKCLVECEGHEWQRAPYFEPSPNMISYCYRNQDQMIVCKENSNLEIVQLPEQPSTQRPTTVTPNGQVVTGSVVTTENQTSASNGRTTSVVDTGPSAGTESTTFKSHGFTSTMDSSTSPTSLELKNSSVLENMSGSNKAAFTNVTDMYHENDHNTTELPAGDGQDSVFNGSPVTSPPAENTTKKQKTDDVGYVYVNSDTLVKSDQGCPGFKSTFSGNSEYGRISSPNLNGQYPNNVKCFWTIQVDTSKNIQLTIIDFKTQGDKDYLKIYQGGSKKLLHTLTGAYLEKVSKNRASGANDSLILDVDSSSSLLEFFTDDSVTDRGFRIEYKAIPEEQKEKSIGEMLNGPSVPAWALGVLALFLIIIFACILGLWILKYKKRKEKERRALIYEEQTAENGAVVAVDRETPEEDYDSTYSLPSTLGGPGTFTSGKISTIDTGSGSQYKHRMGHGGSQRRVAFQNTAFSKDPGLWEVNEDVPSPSRHSLARKSSEARTDVMREHSSSEPSSVSSYQTSMNNNNNSFYGNQENRERRRPRTADDMFTASEFLNNHCPRQETRRQSEPRIHESSRSHKHHKNPRATLDLVIAVPLVPNDTLSEPALIAEEHKPSRRSAQGIPVEQREYKSKSPKNHGKYSDIDVRPNLRYSVNSSVGDQRCVDWNLNSVPRDFLCPITNKVMKQPVTGPDGVIYEKRAIHDWLERHGTSPVTKQRMSMSEMRPDGILKARLREWKIQKREQRNKLERTAAKSSETLLGDVQC